MAERSGVSDGTSKWYLDEDTRIDSFSGTPANVVTNGHALFFDNDSLDGTSEEDFGLDGGSHYPSASASMTVKSHTKSPNLPIPMRSSDKRFCLR